MSEQVTRSEVAERLGVAPESVSRGTNMKVFYRMAAHSEYELLECDPNTTHEGIMRVLGVLMVTRGVSLGRAFVLYDDGNWEVVDGSQ